MNLDHLNVTWRCEACKEIRLDSKISLLKRREGGLQRNVKYCNDNPACRAAAQGILDDFFEKFTM